jgi:hypothetical protein
MAKSMVKWDSFVGKGWHSIIKEAIDAIEDKNGFIVQVKEKFGGLRIYTIGGDVDAIDDITRSAERKAMFTCEECGVPGTTRGYGGWLKTTCEDCNKILLEKKNVC